MRKGMSAAVLMLAMGVVIFLIVVAVIVGLNTSGSFRDFIAKVPWLNKIVPGGDGGGGGGGGDGGGGGEPASGAPSGNVLYFVAPRTDTEGGNTLYVKISDGIPLGEGTKYDIGKGDTLEYDVYLPLKTPCTGGVSIATNAGDVDDDEKWIDKKNVIGTLKNCDADPKKVSADSNLVPYAYRKWYHRVIPLPDKFFGSTLRKVSLVMHGETQKAMYIVLYDNIVMKSGKDGKEHVIFKNDPPAVSKIECSSFGKVCKFDEGNTKLLVKTPAYLPVVGSPLQNDIKSVSGEIIRLTAVGSGGGGKYLYLKAFELGAAYTVSPGDIVEYDVYLQKCKEDVGGIELRDKSGDSNKWKNLPYWKNSYDWISAKIVPAKPDDGGMDLGSPEAGSLACFKWYHRILPAPPKIWGKTVEIVDLVTGYDADDKETVTSYYDNIQITDGTGQIKTFYPGGTDIALYQYDEKEGDGIKGFKDVEMAKITPLDTDHPA